MHVKYSKPIFNTHYGLYHFPNYYRTQLYCDSKFIADIVAKPHQHILNCIHRLLNGNTDNEFYVKYLREKDDDFVKETYIDENGEHKLMFLISSSGASALFDFIDTLPWDPEFSRSLFRSKKMVLYDRFEAARDYISILRNIDEDYPEFNDALKISGQDYDNEMETLYKIAAKESVSNIKLRYDIPADEHRNIIRCYMTAEQLLEFRKLQRADIGLLLSVPDIKERERILKEKCTWSNHTERDNRNR